MITKTKCNCYFCNKPAKVYLTKYDFRVCSKDLSECKGYKAFRRHVDSCPKCLEAYEKAPRKYKFRIRRYDCYKLKYIRAKVKDVPTYNFKYMFRLERGDFKCFLCGDTAKYDIYKQQPCCSPGTSQCPAWSKWLSEKKRELYRTKDGYRERMADAMREVHNREEVKIAKKLKMLHLHNDNCEPCKEFQAKYKSAHKARRGDNYERNLGYIQTWREKKGI